MPTVEIGSRSRRSYERRVCDLGSSRRTLSGPCSTEDTAYESARNDRWLPATSHWLWLACAAGAYLGSFIFLRLMTSKEEFTQMLEDRERPVIPS